jgi:hypothetical protein
MEYLSRSNIRAASLALLMFLYPIVALSFFSVRYIETIHRVSTRTEFDVSLFGSLSADSLAAVGLGLLYLGLSSRLSVSKVILVGIFAAAVVAYQLSHISLVIGALAVLPAILALLAIAGISDKRDPISDKSKRIFARLPFDGKRVGAAFLAIVIVIEAGALTRWVAYPLFPSELYSDATWKFAELESALFHSFGLLSPILVALLGFSFLYRWYILDLASKMVRRLVPKGRRDPQQLAHSVKPGETGQVSGSLGNAGQARSTSQAASLVEKNAREHTTSSRRIHYGLLALALTIAPLLMIYPHLPGINPDGEGISTDERYYLEWMRLMRAGADGSPQMWTDILANAFTVNNGNRPLTLIFVVALSELTGVPDLLVIRFVPVLLAPALVLSNYLLLRGTLSAKHFGSGRVKVFAAVGAIFAVFSPQIIVGEYAGLLANWLAMTLVYFAFYLSIRLWESVSGKQMLYWVGALFAILLVIMLIHVYTWANLLTVISVFAGLSYITIRKSVQSPKVKLLVFAAIVATSFSVDYARSQYFETLDAADPESSLASNIRPNDPSSRWDRLTFTLWSYVGGYLSNPVLYLLALIWVVRTRLNPLSGMMLSAIFILAAPVAVGSTEFQTRVLFNIPIHLVAALSLILVIDRQGRDETDRAISILLVSALALVMATYAMRALANMPLVLPPGYELENEFLLP